MRGPGCNVLVAVDGSVGSLQAARVAVDLAAALGARIRVLAVAGEGSARRPGSTARSGATSPDGHEAELRNTLGYVRRLGAEAGVEVEAVLRRRAGAQPYEIILEEAEEWPADLLFLGRRSHRGLGRALLGSQAEHVLEFAQLPVVVVPKARHGGTR